MSESEKNLIKDLIFSNKTEFFVLWLRKVRFFNILPLFPLFLVASFCLFR